MVERLDETRQSERAPFLERGHSSNLANEAHLYQVADRPAPAAVLPGEFPTFVREPDGSLVFPARFDGSDSLRGWNMDQARIDMHESGDLERLTVRTDNGTEAHFELRDLIDRNSHFREGEHGTRTFDANGNMTYTSMDGKLKIVIDRCGKVLSIDAPKGSYRPSPRRLNESSCMS